MRAVLTRVLSASVDIDGKRVAEIGKGLLVLLGVHVSDTEEKAKKMFGENARLMPTQDPFSSDNGANPVYGMRYIVMGGGADGFTAKQWAVCDRRLMKELVNIVYNTRPTVMQSQLDNPLKDMYTAYVDFGVGWGDARQIIFGNPS